MALPLLRIPVLAFLAGSGLSVWGYHTWTSDSELLQRIEELEQEKLALQQSIHFLRERNRVAQIDVLDQEQDSQNRSGIATTFRFQELDQDGEALARAQEFTIDGKLLYVDAQVIKFDDAFLEESGLEPGSSLLLFRRLFGEFQAPADGYALDSAPRPPEAYSAEANSGAFSNELWQNFWDYANRPEVMERTGVRAMHGEAPSMQLEPGQSYQVELRSSGGLSVRALSGADSPKD